MALQQQTKDLIRKFLMRGLVLSIPGVITIWILSLIFNVADKVVGPITRTLINTLVPEWLHIGPLANGESPFLSFVLLLLFMTVLGGFVSWRWGAKIVRWVEGGIVQIPGIGFVYKNVLNMAAFFDGQKSTPFERVVLIPYPHAGVQTLAFVAGKLTQVHPDGREDVKLKVVVPNPPTGVQGICLVPEADVVEVPMSVEDGIQFYVSLGVVAPERLELKASK